MAKFEREVDIDAPVDVVWKVLTDLRTLPRWFPGIEGVSGTPAAGQGARFEWTSGEGSGSGEVVAFEPMKRLQIVMQLGDDKDSHLFRLEPAGGFLGMAQDETKVTYELDTMAGGGILGKFVTGGNPVDMMRVKKTTHLLRKLVESL